jgi:23S rRNA (adenine-N6)-dimethyltransferase
VSGAPGAGVPRGQHFLRPDVARRFVGRAGVEPDDLVFDLGAGTGALTFLLAARAARVVAVERDPKLVRRLVQRVPSNVSVYEGDARFMLLPRRPFRVVANLPFAPANEIVRMLLAPGVPLVGADVIVQLGAARGWATRSTRCEIVCRLGPSSFVPQPRCDAAVLRIRR